MPMEFLQRLEMSIPIVQAPMAGVSTAELASTVTGAGGLGSVSVGAINAAGARSMIQALHQRTDGSFNVNVFCHKPAVHNPERETAWLEGLAPLFKRFGVEPPSELSEIYSSFIADTAMQELILELRPPVVSFHFGLPPSRIISRLRSAGIVLLSTATNLAEAELAAEAGVDAIVAQGYEAGGHRGIFDPLASDSRLGTLPLTRLLVKKLDLPIIAAGGIMDGAGVAAVLKLGATAAQMGTAFVSCPETSADAAYRAALLGPGSALTEMTATISGRPARSLPNAMTALKGGALAGLEAPDYPIAYDASKSLTAAAKMNHERGFAVQWAGQGAPLVRPMPAADLMTVLRDELTQALR
jgi:nitronate monooxygenase